jgi:hypothetical protein
LEAIWDNASGAGLQVQQAADGFTGAHNAINLDRQIGLLLLPSLSGIVYE